MRHVTCCSLTPAWSACNMLHVCAPFSSAGAHGGSLCDLSQAHPGVAAYAYTTGKQPCLLLQWPAGLCAELHCVNCDHQSNSYISASAVVRQASNQVYAWTIDIWILCWCAVAGCASCNSLQGTTSAKMQQLLVALVANCTYCMQVEVLYLSPQHLWINAIILVLRLILNCMH